MATSTSLGTIALAGAGIVGIVILGAAIFAPSKSPSVATLQRALPNWYSQVDVELKKRSGKDIDAYDVPMSVLDRLKKKSPAQAAIWIIRNQDAVNREAYKQAFVRWLTKYYGFSRSAAVTAYNKYGRAGFANGDHPERLADQIGRAAEIADQ